MTCENDININEIDKIINNLVFIDDFKIHIETHYVHNKDDLTKRKTELLYWIENLKFEGYSFLSH